MNASAAGNRPKFIKKLTPKTVTDAAYGPNFLQQLGENRPVKAQELYKLFGQISRVKTGHTNLGDFIQFKGRFKAVATTGEQFDGGAAHIPQLEDMLFTVLSEAQAADPKAVVEVAISVGVKPAPAGKPSATGYEYEVASLVNRTEATDPLARLMAEAGMGETAPALAAPEGGTAAATSGESSAPPVGGKRHHGGKNR